MELNSVNISVHPDHLRRIEVKSEARGVSGWVLSNKGASLSFVENADGFEVSIGRLDETGAEVVALSVRAPLGQRAKLTSQLEERGLREGFVIGFDEACAVIEAIAGAEKLPCMRRFPSLSARHVPAGDLDDLRMLSLSVKNPADQCDTLTGLPGKAALLAPDSLAALSAQLAGPKVLAFIDFNNMGLANKVGLGKEVDVFLSKLAERAGSALCGMPHKVIRLGGDEFAVVMAGSNERCQKGLAELRKALTKLREDVFASRSETLARAEERAVRRAAMRSSLSRFKQEHGIEDSDQKGRNPFQQKEFRAWVVEGLRRFEHGFLPSRTWTGNLVLRLAEHESAKQREASELRAPRVMTFSMGACELGERPTPEDVSKALDRAEKDIHLQKERGTEEILIAPLGEVYAMVLRSSEREGLINQAVAEREDVLAREELMRLQAEVQSANSETVRLRARAELRRAAGMDPSVGHGVLRFNLVRDLPLKTLLLPDAPALSSGFIVDVNHFGVLNNQLGYPRADALMGQLACTIRSAFPGALVIRKDGGKLVVLSPQEASTESLQILRERAELALRECVNDRVLAEYQIRVAQELWDSKQKGIHLLEAGIRRVRLFAAEQVAIGSLSVGDIIQRLEYAAQVIPHDSARPKRTSVRAAV